MSFLSYENQLQWKRTELFLFKAGQMFIMVTLGIYTDYADDVDSVCQLTSNSLVQ